jgi:hypothetical protein
VRFEKISMGHYFPPERASDKNMKAYVEKIGSNKPYYDYYSKKIFGDKIYLDNGLSFNLVVIAKAIKLSGCTMFSSPEGQRVQWKRTSNLQTVKDMVCGRARRGVPIEKVDDWIEGGRGVGAYTYMHAFVYACLRRL